MQRPTTLKKAQLSKFIEGFNQLIENGPQINRYGFKRDGMEFARTLVLHLQLTSKNTDAHTRVGKIDNNSNFEKLEKDWLVAAGHFGYADLLRAS